MSAGNVPQLLREAGFRNYNRGLVILTDLKVKWFALRASSMVSIGKGLQEQIVSEPHNLTFSRGTTGGGLLAANPH